MKKTTVYIIGIIIVIALAFAGCEYMSVVKDNDRLTNALSLADLNNQKFQTKINKQNQEIATQKQVILSKDEALEANLVELEELKEYKRLNNKIVVETITKIDTLFIPFTPTGDTLDIELPPFRKFFQYQEQDNWYSLSGHATNLGIDLDSISIRNKYKLIIGDKKMGWFKKPSPQVELTNYNPYTSTISMNNVEIEYKLPFYKRNEFWLSIGAILGLLLGGI